MIEERRYCDRHPLAEAGFSLLELLIAMTLLALLTVVIFGGVHFGARAWERTEVQGQNGDEVRLAQTFLRRELRQVYPFYVTKDVTQPRIDFAGTDQDIQFLAPAPNALIPAGRARITIRRVSRDGRFAIELSQEPELSKPGQIERSPELLIDGFQSVEFSYFGSQKQNVPPQWHRQWTNQTALPRLIRIDAEFPVDVGRSWPDLVVAPRISTDANCVFDLLTKNCRGRQ